MWKLVVLPAPFGPSRPTTSPARTSMQTSFTTHAAAERLGEPLGAEDRGAGAVHRCARPGAGRGDAGAPGFAGARLPGPRRLLLSG